MTNRQGSTARSGRARGLAALGAALLLVVAACGDDDDGGDAAATTSATTAAAATTTRAAATTTRAAATTTAAGATTTRAAATTTAAGAATTAAQAKGTIKIGTIGSTVSATTGQPILDETGEIARAWVKQVNDDGGINGYKVELVVKDGLRHRQVLQAVTELDQDGVHAIVAERRDPHHRQPRQDQRSQDAHHGRHAVHAGVRHQPVLLPGERQLLRRCRRSGVRGQERGANALPQPLLHRGSGLRPVGAGHQQAATVPGLEHSASGRRPGR